MSRREVRTVELALSILKRASKRADDAAQTDAVRLSLRVLLPYCDTDALSLAWRICANPNPSQRIHLLKRQVSLIEAVVRRRLPAA